MRHRLRKRRLTKWMGTVGCCVFALGLLLTQGGAGVYLGCIGIRVTVPGGFPSPIIDAEFGGIWLPFWLLLLFLGIPTALLWRVDRRHPLGHCQRCGYNLTGNVTGRCPECGEAVERTRAPDIESSLEGRE